MHASTRHPAFAFQGPSRGHVKPKFQCTACYCTDICHSEQLPALNNAEGKVFWRLMIDTITPVPG